MRKITDGDVYNAVVKAWENGDTDITGGVAPPTVATELDMKLSIVRNRLQSLEKRGKLDSVYGLPPEVFEDGKGRGMGPRISYVPKSLSTDGQT